MIISHQKKFVMFAAWKCASQTARIRLKQYNQSPYPEFHYFNPYLNRVVNQHVTCADFVCLPESKLGYYTVSFVRNPYDRMFSGFLEIIKSVMAQPLVLQDSIPDAWVREHVKYQLFEMYNQLSQAELNFDAWIKLLNERDVLEVGHRVVCLTCPCHYWTHIATRQVVDSVGRVEYFESDFALLCQKLGLTTEKINQNITYNNSPGTQIVYGEIASAYPHGYRYTDNMNKASIDKINTLFADDFALFDYKKL